MANMGAEFFPQLIKDAELRQKKWAFYKGRGHFHNREYGPVSNESYHYFILLEKNTLG